MIPPREMPSDRESRLDAALGVYFAEAAAGRVIDRRGFLADHPDLAADLERFFADDDALEQLLSPLRPARAPAAGTSLGDYELLEVIGTGGTGVVYKARQRSANRLVALKAVRGGALASADGVRRFRAEVATVAALDHPSIVPLYDVGEHAGQPFFTMKLLEGGDLARRLATGNSSPWGGAPDRPPAEAARLMVEVARAVHYAHQRGVLHRDLKPSNVLLDAEGRPHVADFGLAKWLTADASLTETGALVGTPGYMAPEQAVAGAEVTTATDVYGLGAILYALLTGRAPFRGATPLDIVTQVREREPEAPSALCPAVDRDLETVCLKCLRKEPRQRYGSAEALAEDLGRWLRGDPVAARRAGPAERAWRWCGRNPGVTGLIATVGLLLTLTVVGLSTGLVLLSRESEEKERERANAIRERGIADEQRARAVERSRALRRQVYAADVARASRLTLMAQGDAIDELVTSYGPGDGEEDLRGFEWYYLRWLRQGGADGRRVLRSHIGGIYSVAFAPDGKTLATAGSDSLIRLCDVTTGRVRSVLWGSPFMLRAVAYSPDGTTLASAGDDGAVRLWDVASGRVRHTLSGHTDHVYCVGFSPDGSLVASGCKDHWLRLWDAESGQERLRWLAHAEGSIEAVEFSPNGATLASAGGETVKLWELRFERGRVCGQTLRFSADGYWKGARCTRFNHGGTALATAAGGGIIRLFELGETVKESATWLDGYVSGEVTGLAFSPDDRLLASANGCRHFCLWGLPEGTSRRVCVSPVSRARTVAFSPDGTMLASGDADGMVSLWDMRRTPQYVTLPEFPHPVGVLEFADGGRTLVAGTEQGGMTWWDVTGEPQLREERQPPRPGRVVAVSAAGKEVVLGDSEGSIRLWDPFTGSTRRPNGASRSALFNTALSPDGHWLATLDGANALMRHDLSSGERRQLGPRNEHEWGCPRVTPDGQGILAYHSKDGLYLFDARTGARCWRLDLDCNATGIAGSASRRWFAVTSPAGTVYLAGDRPGSDWQMLLGHRKKVNAGAFSPDEKTLATCGADGQVKLWQVETGRELLTLQDHPGENAQCAAFSDDGQVLAVGGMSRDRKGFVRLWYGPRDHKGN